MFNTHFFLANAVMVVMAEQNLINYNNLFKNNNYSFEFPIVSVPEPRQVSITQKGGKVIF